uniref:Conserved oligomeric Golgi complex subunit 6 n=1 Tax=Brugia timori TaxID=42155 RepID=A0A0R3Q901_9BILA
LSRYSLKPEEETALKGSDAAQIFTFENKAFPFTDGTVNAKFFAALQRVKQIHHDSKQLLRSSGEHLAA